MGIVGAGEGISANHTAALISSTHFLRHLSFTLILAYEHCCVISDSICSRVLRVDDDDDDDDDDGEICSCMPGALCLCLCEVSVVVEWDRRTGAEKR